MNIERLKELRKKFGLTQTELAAVFGFSNQRYNYYETGKNEPDNETLVKLADYFKVSTDYLLGKTDIPTPQASKKDPLDGLKFALWGHDDISDAALDDVRRYALFIEQREKEIDDGRTK